MEHKFCDIEIFDIWTSESFPNRFFVFTERVRPMGCHFCTCLNSVLQHCKLMKNTSSAGKGLKTDFQLLVLKLERRGVLFSGLLPPTGGTKTGRKTTFRAHLSYICVKLQICVLQKKSLKNALTWRNCLFCLLTYACQAGVCLFCVRGVWFCS